MNIITELTIYFFFIPLILHSITRLNHVVILYGFSLAFWRSGLNRIFRCPVGSCVVFLMFPMTGKNIYLDIILRVWFDSIIGFTMGNFLKTLVLLLSTREVCF
jgi:hypothetical protein